MESKHSTPRSLPGEWRGRRPWNAGAGLGIAVATGIAYVIYVILTLPHPDALGGAGFYISFLGGIPATGAILLGALALADRRENKVIAVVAIVLASLGVVIVPPLYLIVLL